MNEVRPTKEHLKQGNYLSADKKMCEAVGCIQDILIGETPK